MAYKCVFIRCYQICVFGCSCCIPGCGCAVVQQFTCGFAKLLSWTNFPSLHADSANTSIMWILCNVACGISMTSTGGFLFPIEQVHSMRKK